MSIRVLAWAVLFSALPLGVAHADEFTLKPTGFARFSYDHVQTDPNHDFVGRNSGFELRNVRIGVDGSLGAVSFSLSFDGTDVDRDPAAPLQGGLRPRLRDAFVRYELAPWLGVQVGQSLAPFDAETLRDSVRLAFASRAVGQDGVLPGRGFEEPGMSQARQIGVLLSPKSRLPLGSGFGLSYALMVANGNGQNQWQNDNRSLGFYGRLEFSFEELVTLGAAGLYDQRTVGALPNLYEEHDTGVDLDLAVHVGGLEVIGQIAQIRTTYPTVDSLARRRIAWHAQAEYRFDTAIPFALGYRFASFAPWAGAVADTTGVDLRAFTLRYHTVGLRVPHPKLPVQAMVNYTFTREEASRALRNDRLELLAQVAL